MQCDEENESEIWRIYARSCFPEEMVARNPWIQVNLCRFITAFITFLTTPSVDFFRDFCFNFLKLRSFKVERTIQAYIYKQRVGQRIFRIENRDIITRQSLDIVK